MKLIAKVFFLFIFFVSAHVNAQDITQDDTQKLVIPEAHYPKLPQFGNRVEDFVPKGWKIEMQKRGDLNNDGLEDVVILLQENNEKNMIEKGSGFSAMNTNPRILAVLFAQNNGKFSLVLSNHTLIPRYTDPYIGDFIEENAISLSEGVFSVDFFIFPIFSVELINVSYTFRWQDNKFLLVGYHSSESSRSSGDMKSKSINYLTRIEETTCGNNFSDDEMIVKQTESWPPTITIDDIGNGIEYREFNSPNCYEEFERFEKSRNQ